MRVSRTATATTLALGLVGLAGCGGDAVSEATTTAATSTAPAPPPTATVPGGEPSAPVGDASLPPQNAIPGVEDGTDRPLDTADEFVDVLYQESDPAKPTATSRLEAAGYAGGLLRDQRGTDPDTGVALLRSYAFRVRDADAARQEVIDAVDEVRASTSADTSDVEVDIPGAKALRVDVNQGNVSGAVLFVTFPADDMVYGIQAVASNGGAIPQDEIIGAARDLASKVGATP